MGRSGAVKKELEADVRRAVKAAASRLGWLPIVVDAGGHIRRGGARVVGDVPKGWPDVVLVHPKRPAVFVEVKRVGGRLSSAQKETLMRLEAAGFKTYVVWGTQGIGGLVELLTASPGGGHADKE